MLRKPLELRLRGIDRTPGFLNLVESKVERLGQVTDGLMSCRVAVERDPHQPREGSPLRVRIELRVTPGHQLVVRRQAGEGDSFDPVEKVIREAFAAARRKLTRFVNRRRQIARQVVDEKARLVAFQQRIDPPVARPDTDPSAQEAALCSRGRSGLPSQ